MKIQVRIENQIFDVEVGDLNARPITAVIDGQTFEIFPEEAAAPAVPAMPAMPAPAAPVKPAPVAEVPCADPASIAGRTPDKGKVIAAPIPGVIIAISAKVGDEVTFGQELCVLEAMKMKNAIRATRPGKIAAILVSVGDHVKHGQALIEYAD